MKTDPTALVALASPAAFVLVSLCALANQGPRPRLLERLSVAACGFRDRGCGGLAWLVVQHGPLQSPILGV